MYSSITTHNDRPRAEHFALSKEASALNSVPPLYSLESFHLLSNLCKYLFIREYAESKKCLKDLIYSDCNYPAGSKKLFNFTLGVYNPFCADNRDPGATNNGHCYGVLDDDSATTGATGTTGTTLSDYDPLCMDNRDPGATKNSQCHGGLDGSSAAGTKPSVFQTLMFAFFLFLFLH